jgi:hypothetical protein
MSPLRVADLAAELSSGVPVVLVWDLEPYRLPSTLASFEVAGAPRDVS